jgi:hypothetical protein
MCPTSDPENDELYFGMDFEGDDKFDFKGITGFHCLADHVYAVGTWRPLLCVHDRDKNFHPPTTTAVEAHGGGDAPARLSR